MVVGKIAMIHLKILLKRKGPLSVKCVFCCCVSMGEKMHNGDE